MTSTERIKDGYPHPTIEPIVGQPACESIRPMHQKLNTNTASIVPHLSNGRLGLLSLTVIPIVYNALSYIPFVPPTNHGYGATIPVGATST